MHQENSKWEKNDWNRRKRNGGLLLSIARLCFKMITCFSCWCNFFFHFHSHCFLHERRAQQQWFNEVELQQLDDCDGWSLRCTSELAEAAALEKESYFIFFSFTRKEKIDLDYWTIYLIRSDYFREMFSYSFISKANNH